MSTVKLFHEHGHKLAILFLYTLLLYSSVLFKEKRVLEIAYLFYSTPTVLIY